MSETKRLEPPFKDHRLDWCCCWSRHKLLHIGDMKGSEQGSHCLDGQSGDMQPGRVARASSALDCGDVR
jgi:hypothetical protein